jgi:hypothetical protein
VLEVHDFREGEFIDRELVLVRVAVDAKTRAEIMQMTDIFRAKIVDVQPKSLTIEITGERKQDRQISRPDEDLRRARIDPHRQNRPGAQVITQSVQTKNALTPIPMPAKVYSDKDADLKYLQGKTLAVLGFGSQGHAHALNLKDSGCNVIIGLYEGSKSIPVAKSKGFEVVSTAEAVRRADVIFVAIPDTKQAKAYEQGHRAESGGRARRFFSHGFRFISKPSCRPRNVNVILVAPKGPGHIVRRQYLEGKGVPALIAVYQDPGRKSKTDRAGLGQGHRRHPRGRHPNHLQGRDRNRPVRRTNRACAAALRP